MSARLPESIEGVCLSRAEEEGTGAERAVTVVSLGEPGPENTELTLAAARGRAADLGLARVVVATDSGATARRARGIFEAGTTVVAVINCEALRLPISELHDYTERFRIHREELERKGVKAVPIGLTDKALDELRDRACEG